MRAYHVTIGADTYRITAGSTLGAVSIALALVGTLPVRIVAVPA